MKSKKLLRVFILLLIIATLPSFLVWIHHKLVFGLNYFLDSIFLLSLAMVLLILIPISIRYYRWLKQYWLNDNDAEPVILYAMGILCWAINWALSRNADYDILLKDTYYIISYFIILLYTSVFFGICCTIYFLFPRILKRDLKINLSRIHFWVTFIGLNLLFTTRYPGYVFDETSGNIEYAGQPRRYVEYSGWQTYLHFIYVNQIIEICLILILAAQLLFLFNMVYSLFKSPKI